MYSTCLLIGFAPIRSSMQEASSCLPDADDGRKKEDEPVTGPLHGSPFVTVRDSCRELGVRRGVDGLRG
jgi:hypothetical protein